MHNRLLITLDAPADAGSEQVRQDVFRRLMSDSSFCGEGGLFGHPLCDWFVIGGRWSGLLAETLMGKEFSVRSRGLSGTDAELDALWQSLGGTGPNPNSRSTYVEHGYRDDAMVVTEALYTALLAENEGTESDREHFADLDFDEVSRDFIGRKWLVVVDYHN